MGLPDPVSWPIAATGIATKNAPLMLAPGGQLVLDNVRQERKDEWRTRPGFDVDANDALPLANVPVLCTETPWGGLIGLVRQTNFLTAGRVYSPDVVPRWHSPPVDSAIAGQQLESCAQQTPGMWSRDTKYQQNGGSPSQVSMAEGGGYQLVASWDRFAATGIQVWFGAADGMTISSFQQLGLTATYQRPKCVYSSTANRLCLFWADAAGNVYVSSWNTLTGNQDENVHVLSAAAYMAAADAAYLDAIYYGGATITIAYRNATATGELDIIEYNPASHAATVYHPAISCSNCLSLFPDPDASGIRQVAVSTVVPAVRVLRLNSVGVVQTNHLVANVDALRIAGCAYEAGASWMIVYEDNTAGSRLKGCKRQGGVTSAVADIAPAAIAGYFSLATNAWREAGTDAMRWIVCLNGNGTDDNHNTFYEMALQYIGSAGIDNYWREPQARLTPLNSLGIYFERASLPQVQRTGTDRFVTALPRITKIRVAGSAGTSPYEASIDTWAVQYMNETTRTGFNQGQGTQTVDGAYLPAGSLLQTATGQILCAHGGSSLPFKPNATEFVGTGSLVPGRTYIYGVSIRLPDEAGNQWRSPMSVTKSILITGGNNSVHVDVLLFPFENLTRRRLVDIWRTDGNGSTFKLLKTVDGDILNTISFRFDDQTLDPNPGETYTAEVQTGLTPPMLHVTPWNDRLWGVDRDFPTRVWFTKPLSQGLLPEFISDPATGVEFVVDIDDAYGPITGIAALDDRLVVFKERAVYVGGGDGPDNNGNGQFPTFNRISSEYGMIAGSPFVSTGREVYFVSLSGLYRVVDGQSVDFVGAAIDKYLSMPLLASPETVTGMVMSPALNEVRVQTTNYRFVHDRTFNVWYRDTGGMGSSSGIVMTRMLGGTDQIMITNLGALWTEAADSVTPSDAGTQYAGSVRSAWIRPSGMDGWLRLFRARVLGECTVAGTTEAPSLTVYYDNDDSDFVTFQPRGSLTDTAGPIRAEAQVRRQKCTAFSLQLTLPVGDASVRLDAWSASVEILKNLQPLAANQKLTSTLPPAPVPPSPPAPTNLPIIYRDYTIQTLAATPLGSAGDNQRNLTFKVKDALVTSTQWAVSRSSNGVAVVTGDNWVSGHSLDVVGSWCQLASVQHGWQLLVFVTVSGAGAGGWLEVQLWFSPSVGFTGGTATTRPTATDEWQVNAPFGVFLGTAPIGGDPDPVYRAFVWTSTDGENTWIAWWYAGHLTAWWQVSKISCPPNPTAWVPVATAWWSIGVNPLAASRLGLVDFANTGATNTVSTTPFGGKEVTSARTFETGTATFANQDLTGLISATGQYMWGAPMGIQFGNVAADSGTYGWFSDQYWGPAAPRPAAADHTPAFNEGDTANNGQFIFVGQSMLPWNGSVNPPHGGSATTDRPSTAFYGRSVL